MQMNIEIKNNIKKTIPKIKNLIYLSEPNLIGLPDVKLVDYDYSEEGLIMVLIQVSFKVDTDQTLSGIINHLNDIDTKLNQLMDKISFDENGNLFSAKVGRGLTNNGISLVTKLEYTFRGEEIDLELDFMFA